MVSSGLIAWIVMIASIGVMILGFSLLGSESSSAEVASGWTMAAAGVSGLLIGIAIKALIPLMIVKKTTMPLLKGLEVSERDIKNLNTLINLSIVIAVIEIIFAIVQFAYRLAKMNDND